MNEELFTPTPAEQGYMSVVLTRRRRLKEAFTPDVLKILEDKFQTNLPCFQGQAGSYDPLDAMRRDAYREMILWVQHEIELYDKEYHE